jgi:BAI1-associated protein 2
MSMMNNEEIYGQAPFKQSTLNMRTAASYSNLNHQDDRSMDTLYRSNADLSGKNVKRTKSFWKFSKSEDILEGMAMWKHKDLVPTEKEKLADEKREATLKRNMRKKAKQQEHKEVNNNAHSPPSAQIKPRPHSMAIMEEHSTPPPPYQMTKAEIDSRISKHNQSMYEQEKTTTLTKPTKASKTKERSSGNGKSTRTYKNDVEPDEHEIYGDASTLQRDSRKDKHRSKSGNGGSGGGDMHMWNSQKMKDYQDSDSTLKRSLDDFSMIINDSMRMQENFYDDESIEDIMMKTVKRKEILKQYYSSGTDTERNSTSSDPYDCIVVDDHLVSAADMMIKNNKENLNRSRKTDKQQQQMEFSTFRGNESGKTGNKEKSSSGGQRNGGAPTNDREGGQQQTGTLLPRTKLSKTSGNGQANDSGRKYDSDADMREKQRLVKQREALIKQSYGPWYDLWDKQNGIPK